MLSRAVVAVDRPSISSISALSGGNLGGKLSMLRTAGSETMAFDRLAGGHRFDFSRGVCQRCGMSREKFEDNGRPRCTGKPPEEKIRLTVPPDDSP
jgi:hypothetical protein